MTKTSQDNNLNYIIFQSILMNVILKNQSEET